MDNKKSKKFLEDSFDLDAFKEVTTKKIKKKRIEYNTRFINKLSYFMIIISFICVYLLYNFINKTFIENSNFKTFYNTTSGDSTYNYNNSESIIVIYNN